VGLWWADLLARVTVGLQELAAEAEGDPDGGEASVLDVRPVGGTEGLAGPAGVLPSPG
jgi:hypothetical protein